MHPAQDWVQSGICIFGVQFEQAELGTQSDATQTYNNKSPTKDMPDTLDMKHLTYCDVIIKGHDMGGRDSLKCGQTFPLK